jgi:hypothetical protein
MTRIEVRIPGGPQGDWLVSVEVEDVFARDPRHIHNIKLALWQWGMRNVR